jgi:hypothetical protein
VAEACSSGDAIPAGCRLIEVHVTELRQLFNEIDPSPFHEKDLDAKAEEFIVGWARELPRDAPLALLVHLDRPTGVANDAAVLRDAVREFFGQRSLEERRRLRQLLRVGRTSLVIGLAFLGLSIGVGDVAASLLRERQLGEILRESLLIGGWVAMWRPLEVFLYDWWPIRAEARLLERLSAMPVRLEYAPTRHPDAWRSDWPAVSTAEGHRDPMPHRGAHDPLSTESTDLPSC